MINWKPDISKEELQTLPLYSFDKEVYVLENYADLYLLKIHLNGEKILGFDTETKPSFKKGKTHSVALLQLSTRNKAFLIRVNKIGLPDVVVKLLEDPSIEKIGVAIRDDIRVLQKIKPFQPAGFIDLQSFVKNYGIESSSIKKLAGILLEIRISKSQQLSDWEALQLTEAQQRYAATDAWACFEMYSKLMSADLNP